MSCVEDLTALIAGREFIVRNLHVRHENSTVSGYSFVLYFKGGGSSSYETGSIAGYKLDEITEWLWENV